MEGDQGLVWLGGVHGEDREGQCLEDSQRVRQVLGEAGQDEHHSQE